MVNAIDEVIDFSFCEAKASFAEGAFEIVAREVAGVFVIHGSEGVAEFSDFVVFAVLCHKAQDLSLQTARSREALQTLQNLQIEAVLLATRRLPRMQEELHPLMINRLDRGHPLLRPRVQQLLYKRLR